MPQKKRVRRPAMRAVIPVSIPEAAGKLIGRAATRLDEPLSAFIRDAALERARAVLGEPAEDAPEPDDVTASLAA